MQYQSDLLFGVSKNLGGQAWLRLRASTISQKMMTCPLKFTDEEPAGQKHRKRIRSMIIKIINGKQGLTLYFFQKFFHHTFPNLIDSSFNIISSFAIFLSFSSRILELSFNWCNYKSFQSTSKMTMFRDIVYYWFVSIIRPDLLWTIGSDRPSSVVMKT